MSVKYYLSLYANIHKRKHKLILSCCGSLEDSLYFQHPVIPKVLGSWLEINGESSTTLHVSGKLAGLS